MVKFMKAKWMKGIGIIVKNAVVGEGTKVWHYVNLLNCKIGKNCVIGSYSEICGMIGDNCKIENGVFMPKGVVIQDGVFIGPHVCFTNDRFPRAQGEWNTTSTLVDSGASIGANATILCGVKIGKYAMIGCGAVVVDDVPAYKIVVGNPARIIGDVRNNRKV